MDSRAWRTYFNPNEFFQAKPFETELLLEGSVIHVSFQALDLFPTLPDEVAAPWIFA